ncbi:MAG: C10 family peptidase, partial [Candidatus Delongbacteria bacterium]
MKKLSLIFLFALTALFSKSVEDPHRAAANFIASRGLNIKLADACSEITKNGSVLAYAFSCGTSGYVVVSADDRLIPVIAYSDNSEFEPDSPISELIKNDLESRLSNIDKMDNDAADKVKMRWLDLLSDNTPKPKLDQWPPDGSTSTGGWTETRWNQTPPYNKFCPMDLSSNTRSYTGCPATAMSQILFYHRTVNGTRFEYRRDRYYH